MTELPSDKGGSFGLGNRQFRKGEKPDQDTSWTETPEEKARNKVTKIEMKYSLTSNILKLRNVSV